MKDNSYLPTRSDIEYLIIQSNYFGSAWKDDFQILGLIVGHLKLKVKIEVYGQLILMEFLRISPDLYSKSINF